jgi:hypothetical protein
MISMLIQVPKIRSFLVQSINGPYDFITQQQQTKAQFFTYALDFEMVNCVAGAANGVQFLLEFLRALAKMEIDSSVLLSNSTSEDQKILMRQRIFQLISLQINPFSRHYLS